ncbi:hypothetical protein PsorP6_016259 [Peronosclerospora sorghi]|uniref:Uncharacterized protein n=1 Tax=Peronosclerospora sorghi TaxID=230839 RepID=A0ACC0VKU8_9STRA|nr:hypothetical protein PsorP6_016259 [Peronosclerospora sorghi]
MGCESDPVCRPPLAHEGPCVTIPKQPVRAKKVGKENETSDDGRSVGGCGSQSAAGIRRREPISGRDFACVHTHPSTGSFSPVTDSKDKCAMAGVG